MMAAPTTPADRRIGTIVGGGQYRVLERLGEGGFGTVYLVETVIGGLRRALKVLHTRWAADAASRRRFVNEAIVLEQLSHPNIARCYSAGTLGEEDVPYLLLEYVEGLPLGAMLQGPIEPLRAVRLAQQIASGLVAVHANQVLHRDLTPQNVLIVEPGRATERVKLVDFGIADALDDRTRSGHTAIGTPLFMAPEQLEGAAPVDVRADLWQLGALLHLMLTGRRPHDTTDGTLHALLARHRQFSEAGPAPDAADPSLRRHQDLMRLVSALLAGDRRRRPASAIEVCESLARIEHRLAPDTSGVGALALLEALCAQPSDSGWWAVCRYLAAHEDHPRMAASASVLLQSWPDELRRAPLHWWDAARLGEHSLWPIVRTLDLSGRSIDDAEADALAQVPALATVTRLSLAHNQIGPRGASAIAASPHLAGVTWLDASDNRLGSDGARHLANARGLPHLRQLALRDNGIGAAGATALADGGLDLVVLDLSRNDVRQTGAAALASSLRLRGLRELRLGDNAIGSDGLSALCVSRHLSGLTTLDVSGNEIGPAGAAALALSANAGALESLAIGRNRLGLEGAELLLASPHFGSLTTLDLSSNDIGAQGAMTLSAAPSVRRLRALDLADNRLGDAGLAALLGAPYLTGLRRLRVAQNGITAAGVALLRVAPPELIELDLSGNPVTGAGAAAVAAMLPRMRLDRLAVDDCGLSAADAALLIASGPAGLTRLSLAGNRLEDEPPASPPVVSRGTIVELDVSRNRLGVAGLSALARWPALSAVRTLIADANAVDGDARALAAALAPLGELSALRLRDNELTGEALLPFGSTILARQVTDLDLAVNRVDDAGAASLARAWPSLRRVNLERNLITRAGAAVLWSSPVLCDLHAANVSRNALSGLTDLHTLSERRIALLEQSFAALAPRAADLAARFYERLFERYPSVKPLFAHTAMRRQHQHLIGALTMVIDQLRAPEEARAQLQALGARHAGYGAFPSHYAAVTSVLLDTLREHLDCDWTDELESAWHQGLDAVAEAMMAGQRPGPRDRPAS